MLNREAFEHTISINFMIQWIANRLYVSDIHKHNISIRNLVVAEVKCRETKLVNKYNSVTKLEEPTYGSTTDVISVSNVSAIRYRLDSFKDLSNKVVYVFNKYLNYTKEAL
jgi:hypothetical protein